MCITAICLLFLKAGVILTLDHDDTRDFSVLKLYNHKNMMIIVKGIRPVFHNHFEHIKCSFLQRIFVDIITSLDSDYFGKF